MKFLFSVILACLLLSGCASPTPPPKAETPVKAPLPAVPLPQGLYEAGTTLEVATQGALRVCPLEGNSSFGLKEAGDDLLLFSGWDTTITRLVGDDLIPMASATFDFPLSPRDIAVHTDGRLSCFDPLRQQTLLLDASFAEIGAIDAPPYLSGTPILSADGLTLYYCTPSCVRAWDLETGIHRLVKELTLPQPTLTGLYWDDTMLGCAAQGRTLLLSAETGVTQYDGDNGLNLDTHQGRYIASYLDGGYHTLVFGSSQKDRRTLIPEDMTARQFLLAEQNCVITASPGSSILTLDCYDLATGLRRAALSLSGCGEPLDLVPGKDGQVYLLLDTAEYGQVVCIWDLDGSRAQDEAIYTGLYYSEEIPDHAGLAQCRAYAQQLSQKYGIQILIGDDAAALRPQDHALEPEHRVSVIRQELELLDSRLAQFPHGMLEDTAAHFSGLKIGLVLSITGDLGSVSGLQFLDGTDACIALAPGNDGAGALYHMLFHVMETHILSGSTAFDQWNKLNPDGFRYDYNYQKNAKRDSGIYLTEKNRSFVDTFSMSYPKEDRARVMEYAMLPGQEDVFQTKAMQKKLKALCKGIRDAYGLTDSPEPFLWEQYLK